VKTTVVNIRNGFPKDGVYIGRAGRGHDGYFGNPYILGPGNPRGTTIERYGLYFYSRMRQDPEFRERVEALAGKTLVCFCKPYPCHGDVIATYLNGKEPE
jgi:hypothetical protein